MSVDIDVEIKPNSTHPISWTDAITDVLYMALAIACAYPIVPLLTKREGWDDSVGILFSSVFGLLAVLHLGDAINTVRALRKQKAGR